MKIHSDEEAFVKKHTECKVTRDSGCTWFKLIVLKIPSGIGSLWTFAFTVPQMAAEGSGYLSSADAVEAGVKVIFGLVLGILALFA